jgi:hypothetical protein
VIRVCLYAVQLGQTSSTTQHHDDLYVLVAPAMLVASLPFLAIFYLSLSLSGKSRLALLVVHCSGSRKPAAGYTLPATTTASILYISTALAPNSRGARNVLAAPTIDPFDRCR